MSEVILKVEDLSKQYRLGTIGTGTISHDLNRWWAKVRGKEDPFLKVGEVNDRTSKGNSEYVWVLNDINFSLNRGEVLGIIGKNGAGKSTLLKILSQVTGPTLGSIKSKGRIASLLEVGTGFHPEMTGKENIYLNGAILGMTKKEISSKLDEIIEFSGTERYIDTPVKRYSSGMRVRLAFAVAAHLDPDILIVDEVLAVGDAEFQKKAIGKMKDVSQGEGRTVLFVSHNMASIKTLCNRCIVLKNGEVAFDGGVLEGVDFYQQINSLQGGDSEWSEENAPGNDKLRLLSIEATPQKGKIIDLASGIKIKYIIQNNQENITLGTTLEILNQDDVLVLHVGKLIAENKSSEKGKYSVEFIIPPYFLNNDLYQVNLIFGEDRRYLIEKFNQICQFEVQNSSIDGDSLRKPGVVRPILNSTIEYFK